MEFKQSLAQRIIIAFALMSALVAGAFAMGIVATVHLVEEKLISAGLGGDLQRLLLMDSVEDWSHRPEPDQLFYFSGGPGDFDLPKDLRHLEPGFHEVFRESLSYHAMVEVVDGRRYVLLQDQSDFEERERVLFAVVLVGFVLSLALAVFLGWVLARKVMAPVVRLARQVRHRDQLLGLAPPLAPDYAADEVGELAVAFDATLGRLRQALTREQLFTSDVSHELRTPLMVLASSCELLLENPAIDQRGRNQVERIARACAEMRELVQTFLMLARAQHDDAQHVASGDPRTGGRRLARPLARTYRVQGPGVDLPTGQPAGYPLQRDLPARGDGQPAAQCLALHRTRLYPPDPGARRLCGGRLGRRVSPKTNAKPCSSPSYVAARNAAKASAWACRWCSGSVRTRAGASA